jgi:tetratricopeptide (TPR) repeat protein
MVRHGQYEAAIPLLERQVLATPRAVRPAQDLVRALTTVGRYDAAAKAARDFMQAVPGSTELWTALGEVLALTGQRAAAESALVRAARGHATDSLTAKVDLALLKLDRGHVVVARRDLDGFIDVYNRGRRLTSRDLTAVATAVRCLAATNPQLAKDALRAYDEAIAADSFNLDPKVAEGDLLLERYNGTDALAAFQGVLARNPREPRALLGLARTRRFDGAPDAESLARRALQVNPNFTAARVFLAQVYLESEDYDAAAGEVTHALEVNPASLDALAARAAVEYLKGDSAAFQGTVRQVLALNPADAALYTLLSDVSARGRRYDDAARFARRAIELDSTSWHGWSLLGINQLRAGQVDSARASLDIAFRGDPFDVWTKNTLDLLDQLVHYSESRSPRFNVYIAPKESAVLSLYMNDVLETGYDSLSARYDYRPAAPVRVEVFPHHSDFSVRTVGLVGLGALGVSFGSVIAMDSPSARDQGEFAWGPVAWHELSHVFHLGLTDHRVPRWFTEGLAEYEERRARPGWGDGVSLGWLIAYHQGRLHAVSDLNAGFSRPAYPEQLIYSYYQASLVCEMIEREKGAKGLLDFLRGYRDGKGTADLIQSVMAMTPAAFDRHFDDYVGQRFGAEIAAIGSPDTAAPPSREALARRSANPADFMAQFGMGHALMQEGKAGEAVPFLERARNLVPDLNGEDSPRWLLTQALLAEHDTLRAVAELKALTAANAQIYGALTALADILRATGDSVGEADALDKTMYVWPLDLAAHRRLAALSERLHQWRRTIRERRAVVALEPVDHAEALYQLARAYLLGGDRPAARRTVLQALAVAPNFPAAQDLLVSLSSGGNRE